MATYKIGYFVGSLAKGSINRTLSQALIRLAHEQLQFTKIPIGDLPLYSYDFDAVFPPQARALKEGIEASDGILFVFPEYNRSIPGALKNAIDWGSRPWGTNSFARKPTGIIGASPGSIGTAVMPSSMRSVLSFLDAPQLNALRSICSSMPRLSAPTAKSRRNPRKHSCGTTWTNTARSSSAFWRPARPATSGTRTRRRAGNIGAGPSVS